MLLHQIKTVQTAVLVQNIYEPLSNVGVGGGGGSDVAPCTLSVQVVGRLEPLRQEMGIT